MSKLSTKEIIELFNNIYLIISKIDACRNTTWYGGEPMFDSSFLHTIIRDGFSEDITNIKAIFRHLETQTKRESSSLEQFSSIIFFLGQHYKIDFSHTSSDGYSYLDLLNAHNHFEEFYSLSVTKVSPKLVVKTEYVCV